MPDYFESGFCVRERSWHGKELLLQEAPETWDEARMAGGLMWEPRLQPLYRQVFKSRPATPEELAAEPDRLTVPIEGLFMEAAGAKLVERDDTGDALGVVSDKFELITHADMGAILEPIMSNPAVKFETAGVVRGGRSVYAVLLLDEPYVVAGDKGYTLPYFAVLNSHDGSGACKGLYTQVRVVCANTYQAADMDGDRHGAQFSLRHTTGLKQHVEEARHVIDGARSEAQRWQLMMADLFHERVTAAQELQFLSEFIPEPPAGIVSDRVRANVADDRAAFLRCLRDSETNADLRGSALSLVHASVEYLDHIRGFRNRDTHLGRSILRPEPLKAKALKLVRELVATA